MEKEKQTEPHKRVHAMLSAFAGGFVSFLAAVLHRNEHRKGKVATLAQASEPFAQRVRLLGT